MDAEDGSRLEELCARVQDLQLKLVMAEQAVSDKEEELRDLPKVLEDVRKKPCLICRERKGSMGRSEPCEREGNSRASGSGQGPWRLCRQVQGSACSAGGEGRSGKATECGDLEKEV